MKTTLWATLTANGNYQRNDSQHPPRPEALADFAASAAAWRAALAGADDAALDTVGYCTYPYGSDPEDAFLSTVWWVNQEVLHHGAEIALLRDLYRARRGQA